MRLGVFLAKKKSSNDWLANGIVPESPRPSKRDVRKAASLVNADFIISIAEGIVSLESNAEEVKLWKKDETARFSRLVELIDSQMSGQQSKVSPSPIIQIHVDNTTHHISDVIFPDGDSKLKVEIYYAIGIWVDEYIIYKHQKETQEEEDRYYALTITPREYIERLHQACSEFGRLWAIWEMDEDEVWMWEISNPLFGNILSLGVKASLDEGSDYHYEWLKGWYLARRELFA